jgi:outer membrane cobalamin receptor
MTTTKRSGALHPGARSVSLRAAKIIIAAGLSTAFVGSALAVEDSSLEEVVVTAKSIEDQLPQQIAQYGTHLDVVTATQILNGGYLDVAQTLQTLVPGLYVSSQNGPFDYVQASIQGSRTEDILWLVDGIRINNRLYGGTTPLDTIPASMIERIEVLDGGQALFYGTQAVAGAVNIVTKAFSDEPSGLVNVGGDTNLGKSFDGYFRDTIRGNHFVFFASHNESPGFQPYPTADYQPSGTDRHRFYDLTSLGAKYGYSFTDDLTLSAAYTHTLGKLDFARPFVTNTAYNNRDEDLVSGKLDYTGELVKFYIKDYFHSWHSHYTETDNGVEIDDGVDPFSYTPAPPGTTVVANDHDFWGYKDYGINLLSEFDINRGLEYVAGYDFQNYTGRDTVLVIQQETEHVNAVFAQLRVTPDLIPGTHLAAGVRYNVPSIGQSAVVWNAGGQYDITSALYLKANVGTAFRLPTAEELFANDPEDERGDPNLKPETSTNANASLGGSAIAGSTSLKWEVIGFYRRIKNLIDFESFDAATGQDVFGNAPGDINTHGVEVTFDIAPTADLSANINATYTHSRETGSNVQFDQIPVTQVKAGLDYHPHDLPFGASVTAIHVGDVADEPFGEGEGRFGYGNYTVVDFNSRVFLDPKRHHRIDLHLNNAFDKTYYSGLTYGINDTNGNPYVVHNLGLPRTFSAYYTYSF